MSARGSVVVPIVAACIALAASAATAQTGNNPAMGPMTIERMHSGFAFSGDVKATRFDGHTDALIGGQAGWITDDSLFVGGAGYWLATGSHDRGMAYGGLVVQWLVRPKERVGFSAKGLVGGGEATLTSTVIYAVPVRDDAILNRIIRPPVAPILRPTTVRFDRGFFIAEPEADVFVRLTRRLRLSGGVGYRFTGTDGTDDDRVRGATATVSLHIS